MSPPTWAEHIASAVDAPGAPLGGWQPEPVAAVAIPEGIKPTAVYAPGLGIPEQRDPEYGAFLLSSVCEYFGYYSRYQQRADQWKITLWSFMTHIREPQTGRPLVPMIPRFIALGESGTGKSTDLELLNLVCARTDGLASEPTQPALRSMLGPEMLTVLLDEGDIFFGTGKRKEAARSALNVSCYPNGHIDIMRGGAREKAKVYGPAAVAALPAMEVATGSVLESLFNRSHIIHKVAPKERIPQILEEPEGQKLGLQARVLMDAWVQENLQEILVMIPVVPMPDELIHRGASKWRAMLAIAHVAGGLWPQYALAAALGKRDNASLEGFRSGLASLGV